MGNSKQNKDDEICFDEMKAENLILAEEVNVTERDMSNSENQHFESVSQTNQRVDAALEQNDPSDNVASSAVGLYCWNKTN